MPEHGKTTIGQAIDSAVSAIGALDAEDRKTALVAIAAHLKIVLVDSGDRGTGIASPSRLPGPLESQIKHAPALPAVVDIRTLKQQKDPSSASQMACIVAYYLQEHAPANERSETVSSSDLQKYFKQAGFELPKAMPQVLPDAKSAGYFDSAERGKYKLNAVGYNLVVHKLPAKKAE